MSLIGKKINEFKATAYQNGEFINVTSDNLRGKWSVVVFYPADFTFVCPTELVDMAETSERIKKIQFPMVADPTGKISREFEVLVEEEGLALRGSFVINPEGVIVAYEVHDMGIGREASELLRKLQAAKFVAEHGEVCPAKWQPGKETLKPSIDLVGKL